MKFTIFGATGGTGQQLVAQALAAGHEVVAFARDQSRLRQHHERLMVESGELSDQAAVERAIQGASAVISVLDPRANPQGLPITRATQTILAAMQKLGVRRLVVSSTRAPVIRATRPISLQIRRGRHPAVGARRLPGHRAHRRVHSDLGPRLDSRASFYAQRWTQDGLGESRLGEPGHRRSKCRILARFPRRFADGQARPKF